MDIAKFFLVKFFNIFGWKVSVFVSCEPGHFRPEIENFGGNLFCQLISLAFSPGEPIIFRNFSSYNLHAVINRLELKSKLIMLFKGKSCFFL